MARRWAELTEEERAEKLKARWLVFAEHYPERARVIEFTQALIAAGGLAPDVCDHHGPMTPTYDWSENVHVGWRCYPCRKAAS